MIIRENEFKCIAELIEIGKHSFPNSEVKTALCGMENILFKVKKRDLDEKANELKKQQQNLFSEAKA